MDITLAVGDGTRRMTYAELPRPGAYRWPRPDGWRGGSAGLGRPAMTALSASLSPWDICGLSQGQHP